MNILFEIIVCLVSGIGLYCLSKFDTRSKQKTGENGAAEPADPADTQDQKKAKKRELIIWSVVLACSLVVLTYCLITRRELVVAILLAAVSSYCTYDSYVQWRKKL